MRGQWYIVAAVMISYVLLTLSNVFSSYEDIDFSPIVESQEDTILLNLVEELNRTIENSYGVENTKVDISDFLGMAERNLVGNGYFFDYECWVGANITRLEIGGKNMRITYSRG